MQEQLQTLTLEEAFAHELAKDVKLKGGGTAIDPDTGQPLKPAKAIAMSIMQQALKGDIAAVSFIRNFLRQNDPQEAAYAGVAARCMILFLLEHELHELNEL